MVQTKGFILEGMITNSSDGGMTIVVDLCGNDQAIDG